MKRYMISRPIPIVRIHHLLFDAFIKATNGIRALCISETGEYIACGDRIGNIRIYTVKSKNPVAFIEAHDGELLCMSFSKYESGNARISFFSVFLNHREYFKSEILGNGE